MLCKVIVSLLSLHKVHNTIEPAKSQLKFLNSYVSSVLSQDVLLMMQDYFFKGMAVDHK